MANQPSAMNSIGDMKKFVEEYPEFRKLGGNVSKHVALVGELSRLVEKYKLLDLGEVEQGLASSSGADLRVSRSRLSIHSNLISRKAVQSIVVDGNVSAEQKLRIVILFALRYQKSKANDIANLITLMLDNGVPPDDAKVLNFIYLFICRMTSCAIACLCFPKYSGLRSTAR